jgi:hypothetical protein
VKKQKSTDNALKVFETKIICVQKHNFSMNNGSPPRTIVKNGILALIFSFQRYSFVKPSISNLPSSSKQRLLQKNQNLRHSW